MWRPYRATLPEVLGEEKFCRKLAKMWEVINSCKELCGLLLIQWDCIQSFRHVLRLPELGF